MSIQRNKHVIGGIRVTAGAILSALLAGSSGCSPAVAPLDQITSASQNVNNASALASSTRLSIKDPSGNEVFQDKNTFSLFKITKGVAYNVAVTSSNLPTGSNLELQITSNAQVGATAKVISLSGNGDQAWSGSIPANLLPAADYNAQLIVKSSAGATLTKKSYTASVACATSPLRAQGAGSNLITATATGPARFNFSAANLVNAVMAANSSAPQTANSYQCAFDYTGIAAMDGTFGPCTRNGIVANYVGVRNLSVQVRESSCNTTLTQTASVNLGQDVPGGANAAPFGYGNVPGSYSGLTFIWGQVQGGGTGAAATNARVGGNSGTPGVNYLAVRTPSDGYLDVTNQSNGPTLTGFGVRADYAYAQPGVVSPTNFGMSISVNLGSAAINALNLTPGQSSYPAVRVTPAARISAVAYKTDQIGDSDPALALSGTSCTTTNVYVQPTTVSLATGSCGAGCTMTGANAGTDYQLTYLAWGDYSCQVTDGSNTVTVRGTFAGQSNIEGDTTACGCGGQGQGGGSGGGPLSF